MCDKEDSKNMSAIDETHQLIDAASIKQEPDIKEEPQSVADLTEFPHLVHHGDGQPSIGLNRFVNEDNFTNSSIAEVKNEVKDETEENSKKNRKSNELNANETNHSSKQKRHARRQQFNRNDRSARNSKMPTKATAQAKTPQQHQCEHCEYSTKYKHNFKIHSLTHTVEKPFPCDRCEKAFTSKQNLQNHLKVHVEEFMFHCAVCFMGFDKKNKKIEHQIDCTTLRYECHLCNKSFGSFNDKLINHMRVHSGSKPFECTECSKQFTRKSYLKVHMELHAGPRSFRCSICRKRFARQNEMIEHELRCNRRVYECYVCHKSFGLVKGHLALHMNTHTGIRAFECRCSQCPMKFTHKSCLNRHIEIHSRSLPWKCAICRHGFSMQTQWKAHQQNCCRRVYECYRCKKFFGPYLRNLKGHMMKHSGEKPFKCGICSNRFTQKSNLTTHMKSIHKKKNAN